MIPAAPSTTRPLSDEVSSYDERFMRLALALGGRNLGSTWPNPSVGAVVVDESGGYPIVLAQGMTQPGGRPHAERVALDVAGEKARGATLYVSLEPCSHFGRSPPCVEAVIAAGIGRVVTALEDPDERVSGRGHSRLRDAGITVVTGVLASEAHRVHRGHILRVTRGRPAVTLKLARTQDGFAARKNGPRLLVTGEAASRRVHLMRAHADAIMVGVDTLLGDDPLLNVRLAGLEGRSPVRVVLDSKLRTPPTARIFSDAAQVPCWIVTTVGAPVEAERRLVARGAEVLRVDADAQGRVELLAALQLLALRGITRVFCEGGPALGEALASADLVDELIVATGQGSLSEEGVPALGPSLASAIGRVLVSSGTEILDRDRFESFERQI